MEAINVGDIGTGQLLGELCPAAGETPPLEAGLVGWALRLRAGQLLVHIASETLSYRYVECNALLFIVIHFYIRFFFCLALHCHKQVHTVFFFLL